MKAAEPPKPLRFEVDGERLPVTVIEDLKRLCEDYPGDCDFVLEVRTPDGVRRLRFGQSYRVAARNAALRTELDRLLAPASARSRSLRVGAMRRRPSSSWTRTPSRPTGSTCCPTCPGEPLPPLSPRTGEPAGPDDLTPIFPMALIGQEVSTEPEIPIPDAVRDAYRLWRPTPLYRARAARGRRSARPARIFYKYEGVSPAGSHKPNTAVPQAYENAQAGIEKLCDGDRCGPVGLGARVRLLAVRARVRGVHGRLVLRPEAVPALDDADVGRDGPPLALSDRTEAGRSQAEHPTGSLGIAISEAVEVAAQDPECNYSLGSVLNHVLLHQTVIGQEAIAQLAMADAVPDVIVGCVGGGSNFAGLVFPFLREGSEARIVAAEPAACPTLTRGVYGYDYGDTVGMTPLMPMYTLGHGFVPPPVHAGGLRYHGDAPMVCGLVKAGRIEARAYKQNETFEAAVRFARSEGIIPAPEPAHAIRAVIEEARGREGGGRGAHDPVRPLRPRQLRSRRLRRLPGRRARGPGVLRGGAPGRARRPPGGARDRLTLNHPRGVRPP